VAVLGWVGDRLDRHDRGVDDTRYHGEPDQAAVREGITRRD